MEFRDLQYFATVAEHQNIGRAAEALNLSATALSKCLRRLESSIGAKLVQRAAKGVALTAVGAALLARIRPLEGMLNDLRHEAADLAVGRTGHINIGTISGTLEKRLARAYVSLLKESPAITAQVTVGVNSALGELLRKGEIDFCIARPRSLPVAEFVFEHLYDDPYVVFASAHHRLAKRKQVSIRELAGERWAAANGTFSPQWQALFGAFEDSGLRAPLMSLEANSVAFTAFTIAHSDHIGLCSRALLQQVARLHPLVELPVKELTHVRRMFVVYRKGAYLSPAALRLIEIVKQQAKDQTRDRPAKHSVPLVALRATASTTTPRAPRSPSPRHTKP
jgi:DNA-binding transcriptional LysR family regulator